MMPTQEWRPIGPSKSRGPSTGKAAIRPIRKLPVTLAITVPHGKSAPHHPGACFRQPEARDACDRAAVATQVSRASCDGTTTCRWPCALDRLVRRDDPIQRLGLRDRVHQAPLPSAWLMSWIDCRRAASADVDPAPS